MKKLNRMEMPEKRTSEIEDRQTEIIQHEQQREKKDGKKNWTKPQGLVKH